MARAAPIGGGVFRALTTRRARLIRIPAALILIAGGFLAVLPVFGLWMLPLGLLLLAIDVPALRPAVSAMAIRLRRWLRRWRARISQAADR